MENKESVAEPRKVYFIKKALKKAHVLVGFFNEIWRILIVEYQQKDKCISIHWMDPLPLQ